MSGIPHFSEAEKSLLCELGQEWLIEPVERGSIVEPKAWEMAALDAFVQGKAGPAVDALRKVMQALTKCSPYRRTAEFDALCNAR